MTKLPLKPHDELPPNSNCVRHAAPRHMTTPLATGAFLLRGEEGELSFGWLEYFAEHATYYERLKAVCHTQSIRPNATGRLLCVDIDAARAGLTATEALSAVRVLWTPIQNDPKQLDDPCHASAVGLPPLSEALRQAAAEQFALAVRKDHEWRELYKQKIAPKTW